MKEAVGLMGGTFDPIHFGHLAAAEEARVRFQLARVIFVPNGQPPHKPDYLPTPAEARYEMVVLATASNPGFEASRVEIDRPGPSYAVDTVHDLGRQLGFDTQFHFIAGTDALLEMLTWREPEHLVQSCEFIAVSRPGYELHELQEKLPSDLLVRIHMLEVPGLWISSTELRRRATAGLSLRYLTPYAVVRYIAAHGLYSRSPTDSPGLGL
ncbi:MAG: nicotinate-nucleotide adenylyltransferase [Armatimonadota bacterium]|nr:MAG: nicotinate-nucleotide adenylyltransferase [Armatimonadota bacterium]